MPTVVVCPGCQAAIDVPDETVGKRVRCRKCRQVFTATAAVEIAEEEEEDELVRAPSFPILPEPGAEALPPGASPLASKLPPRSWLARAFSDTLWTAVILWSLLVTVMLLHTLSQKEISAMQEASAAAVACAALIAPYVVARAVESMSRPW